jgi:hypothetical protein
MCDALREHRILSLNEEYKSTAEENQTQKDFDKAAADLRVLFETKKKGLSDKIKA